MARIKNSNSEETVRRILAAFAELVAESSPKDSFSVRQVAERAELSPGTVTYYFPTKDALIAAGMEPHGERLRSTIDALIAGADEQEDLLGHMAVTMFRFAVRERHYLELKDLLIRKKHPLSAALLAEAQELNETGARELSKRLNIPEPQVMATVWSIQAWVTKMILMDEGFADRFLGENADESQLESMVTDFIRRAFQSSKDGKP